MSRKRVARAMLMASCAGCNLLPISASKATDLGASATTSSASSSQAVATPNVTSAPDPYIMPAEKMFISPGGVDLRTGRMTTDQQELAIGSGAPGSIEFKRTTPKIDGGDFGQFDDNWNISLANKKSCSNCTDVRGSINVEGSAYNFTDSPTTSPYVIPYTSYARLVRTAVGSSQAYYTLTTASGTVVVFQTMAFPADAGATPVTMTNPDGTVYSFSYSGIYLQSVTSNAGYKLILERMNSSSPGLITKACVVNLARMTAGSTCPTGVQTTSYVYAAGRMTSATDRTGSVWTFGSTASPVTESYYKPGDSTPYLVNTYGTAVADNSVITSQDFSDGRHFTYSYQAETYWIKFQNGDETDRNFNLGQGWTESAGGTSRNVAVLWGSDGAQPPYITPNPLKVTDSLNRSFHWAYPRSDESTGLATTGPLQGRTMPEGNSEAYTYDAYFNVTKTERSPKPGSSLAHVITTATFANCSASSLVSCNQPTATVDANGHESDYTYNATHGGVLTETLPADPNGIRPVKRYAYAQRYAWIANGSGGYVHASSPIWVKTEERTCRTTATVGNACAGGSADEVVTAYDYGPDSGPNNLWLRGMTITADGQTLRTCYSYDDYGRKLSETNPLGTSGSCS
jgi:YD repeat-containing protein